MVTFQKEKHIFWCDFCGCSVCQECLSKERPYVNGEIDKDGKRARGKVCKLCDRKILVRQMLLKSQSEVSQKTSEQRKIMKQIEEEREQNR